MCHLRPSSLSYAHLPPSLDRLLLLLDTGSSSSIRNTAAKQLAQLAARSLISDVALEDDIKSFRPHVSIGDTSAWSELLAVVARVSLFHICSCAARHTVLPSPRYYHFYIQRATKLDRRPLMPSHKSSLSYLSGVLSQTVLSHRWTFR